MNDKGDYFSGDLFFCQPTVCLILLIGWGWDGFYICPPFQFIIPALAGSCTPPYTHMLNPPTHTYAHTPPSTQSRLLHGMCPPLSPSCICCSPVLYFPLDDKMNLHIFPRERSLECINRPPPSLTSRL